MDRSSTNSPSGHALRTRPATVDDAENLSRLAGELGYPATPEEMAGRVAELNRDPEAALFVAVDPLGAFAAIEAREAPSQDGEVAGPGAAGGNGAATGNGAAGTGAQGTPGWAPEVAQEIVGWVHVVLVKSLVGARRAHLGGLIVDGRYRGRRVGRTLLARAETWAADQGCKEMVVRTRSSRAKAHAFYEGRGYVRSKTQHVYKREL